jgi:AP-4 complex subunit epsilon-1
VTAVSDQVHALMAHTHEMIRKKAVMVLINFNKAQPIDQFDMKMKKALCDKDPSVMAASLNYFKDEAKKRPNDFKDLVESFIIILKQVTDHRLPRDFDYHRMPAPWI